MAKAVTVTWQEEGGEAHCFTIPAEVVDSFESFRLTQKIARYDVEDFEGGKRTVLKEAVQHASVLDLIVAHMKETLLAPVVRKFPPVTIRELVDAQSAAAAKLVAAQSTLASTLLTAEKVPS